jgi:hypothetical protein
MNNTIISIEELDKDDNKPIYSKIFENIYCFGDACLTHLDEEKSLYPIRQCAQIVAKNIRITLS